MTSIDSSIFGNLIFVASQDSKLMFLAMGVATFAGGILMLLSHKKSVNEAFSDRFRSDAFKRMELRKYRRRSATSSMIAIIGALIAGCYFVTDSRVAVGFSLAIVILVLLVGSLAIVDFFSVGFQQIVSGSRQTDKAVLDEIVRQHQASKKEDEVEEGSRSEDSSS